MKLPIQSANSTRKSFISTAFGISNNILPQQLRLVSPLRPLPFTCEHCEKCDDNGCTGCTGCTFGSTITI